MLDAPPTYGAGPAGPVLPTPASGPPAPRPGQPRGLVVAVVALSVLLVLALIAVGLSRRTDESTASSRATPSTSAPRSPSTTAPGTPPSTRGGSGNSTPPRNSTPGNSTPSTTAPAPSSSGLPQGPAPSAADVQAVVDQLVPFVEQQRGVAFTTKPTATLVGDADFGAKLTAVLEPERATVQRRGTLLQAMTVVAPNVNIVDARNQILANETVARYDPAAKVLLVRAVPITGLTNAQVVRELARALDDQVAGIARPQYATDEHELAFTFAALVDGDAARIAAAWVRSLPDDQQNAYQGLVQQVQSKSRPKGLNQAIIDLIEGPATAGQPFVQQLLTQAGDRFGPLLTTPPASTMQLLHLDRFLAGDEPVDVDPPHAPGTVVDHGVFGEQLTSVVLADVLPPDKARAAADGWMGDSYVSWKASGTGTCVAIHYVMSSVDEATELADAFTTWARSRGGVQIDDGNGRRPELQVISCGGAAAGQSPL